MRFGWTPLCQANRDKLDRFLLETLIMILHESGLGAMYKTTPLALGNETRASDLVNVNHWSTRFRYVYVVRDDPTTTNNVHQ